MLGPSGRLTEQQAAAPEKLGERFSANLPQQLRDPLVRERAQLFWHREAPLAEASLRRLDLQMQRVREIGASGRDRE